MGAGKRDTANCFSWCHSHEVFISQFEHGIIKSQRSSLLQNGCFNCADVHRHARTSSLNKYLLCGFVNPVVWYFVCKFFTMKSLNCFS